MINKKSLRLLYHNSMYQINYRGRLVCQSVSKELAQKKARYLLGGDCIGLQGKKGK